MPQQILNAKNQVIGLITELNDKLYIQDKSGNYLGYYSKSFDKTCALNGKELFNGNMLTSLLQG